MPRANVWPEGKAFAFSIFDDTDRAFPGNFEGVYRFLADEGIRTTKSVWPIRGVGTGSVGYGATCEDPDYLRTLLDLRKRGFEIGYHGATFHGATRPDIERALDAFRKLFGSDPRAMSNHADSADAIYWGDARLSGLVRLLYNALTRGRNRGRFLGHRDGSEYFWGDLCRERVKYVRNFVFARMNTLGACPWMPYHDPSRPYVNYWFASSNGDTVSQFTKCIREEEQDRLEEQRGACILFTHFAKGFQSGEALDSRFRALMKRLAAKNGWFVPVSTLLDYLLERRGAATITPAQRRVLEVRWFLEASLGRAAG